jgi:hypothetical protein
MPRGLPRGSVTLLYQNCQKTPWLLSLGMNGLPGAKQGFTCAAEAFKSDVEWRD